RRGLHRRRRRPTARAGCSCASRSLLLFDVRDVAGGGDLRAGLGGDTGSVPVTRDVVEQRRSTRASTGLDVAGGDLALLDEYVRVERQREQVVERVAGDQPDASPVIG